MANISIPSLVLISFPEAIMLCLFGLMSVGRFSFLEKRNGLLKIALFAAIVSVLIFFIRPNLQNEMESMLVYMLLIFIMFIALMRLKFYESIFAMFFATLLFILTEGISIVTISAITGIKVDQNLTDIMRFLITLPERVLQVLMVYLSYKYSIKIVDFQAKESKKKGYYIQLFVYAVSAGMLTFLTVLIARLLLFDNAPLLSKTTTMLLRINIYLTLFVTIVLVLAIKSINDFYKNRKTLSNNEISQSLEYISNLAESGDMEKVKEALQSLKIYVEKQ